MVFFYVFYFEFKVDLRYRGMRATDLNFRVNVAAILLADVSKSNLYKLRVLLSLNNSSLCHKYLNGYPALEKE